MKKNALSKRSNNIKRKSVKLNGLQSSMLEFMPLVTMAFGVRFAKSKLLANNAFVRIAGIGIGMGTPEICKQIKIQGVSEQTKEMAMYGAAVGMIL